MNSKKLVEKVVSALNDTTELQGVLKQLQGMSSAKGRHFLNRLCSGDEPVNYLEIGTWMGSTFVSALYQNQNVNGFAIDNFSGFVQSKNQPLDVHEVLKENLKLIPHGKFFDCDCWKFDKSILPPIDIYFYDGEHDYESQKKAITEYIDSMSDSFILIVDDWQFEPHIIDVQDGTLDGLLQSKVSIVAQWLLSKADGYHEGMYVAVIEKVNGKK